MSKMESRRFKMKIVFKRDKGICQICDQPTIRAARKNKFTGQIDGRSPTLDHIVPRSKGGSSHTDNLRLAHYECNHKLGDKRG